MANSAIRINNLTANPFSLDVPIEDRRQLRKTIPVGSFVNVQGEATVSELERSPVMTALIAAGKLSVTVVADDELPEGMGIASYPDDAVVANDTQTMAVAAGWIRVTVGTATRYIQLYSDTPA